MCYFAAAKQTSTANLVTFFKTFRRGFGISVNETKDDDENASNRDEFGFGVNKE